MRAWLKVPPLFRIKIVIGGSFIEVVIIIVIGHANHRAHGAHADLVTRVQGCAAASINLAVDGDFTFRNCCFCLSTCGNEAGQFNKLA